MEQLKLLWELQEIEQEILRREKDLQNISAASEYRQKKKDFLNFQEELKKKEENYMREKKELKRRELELQTVSASLKEMSNKLYSGEIRSAKELESLEKKVQLKKKEKSELEERILFLMESQEHLEESIEALKKDGEARKAVLQQLNVKARREMQKIQGALAQLNGRRQELKQNIDAELLEKYRWLSSRKEGRCISLVSKGFCGICNVSLPSSFRARILTPGELVFCENCGCLLVLGD